MIDETGGPAFPLDRDCCNVGMTLRDYFAAKAMEGLIVNSSTDPFDIAKAAYIIADFMLKERAK